MRADGSAQIIAYLVNQLGGRVEIPDYAIQRRQGRLYVERSPWRSATVIETCPFEPGRPWIDPGGEPGKRGTEF